MNTISFHLSVLCILQFLSSVSFNFQCACLSPSWLNLFLGILFFWEGSCAHLVGLPRLHYFIVFDAIINTNIKFYLLNSLIFSDSLLRYRNKKILYINICILQLYWIHLLALAVSLFGVSRIFCICHLQIITVLILHFKFGFLLFFSCLIALARTSNTIWIKVVRTDILVFFLILEEIF